MTQLEFSDINWITIQFNERESFSYTTDKRFLLSIGRPGLSVMKHFELEEMMKIADWIDYLRKEGKIPASKDETQLLNELGDIVE